MRPNVILCLNSGSSSLKFTLFRFEERLAEGAAERIGLADSRFRVNGVAEQRQFSSHQEVVQAILNAPEMRALPRPEAVGHRVVHGGPDHTDPQPVTRELMEQLKLLIPLAPLHLPAQIQVMEFVAQAEPSLPQVACFDTAFHRSMPEIAQRLPLPRAHWEDGLRRYGFHGLSYEYIVSKLGDALKGATVIAHLGNGASLAALRDGKPVDTTMGLTPAGGLMMGTRTGDLDPGVLFFLANEKHYDPGRLAHLVEEEAGLLGVSGITSDMQRLLEASGSEPNAAQAVEMFCYYASKHIGAMAAALGGLDLLVFTGGIGEHAAPIRERICSRLGFLGVALDPEQNAIHAEVISRAGAPCTVRVIPTDEDLMIARHVAAIIARNPR
ncbi:MAG: acetate/propionate family kinase [Bryobacteraceae bacterium]